MKSIIVENLSKRYQLGVIGSTTLADSLTLGMRKLFKKTDTTEGEFWALKNVNFDVEQGEVLGIVGRNGAGKSTLLKVLSKITEPTEGRIKLQGRISSLLEVGTGFHPELTGRENIFLNGSILGMQRTEITRKFDEIVAFSGVEKFLDTPVKRYSSGMYVRLAFAVAAHLEPEVLVIDEVLSVGDAEFQKKCLGKMSEIATGGRTIVFVSHNLGAVSNLCSRAIYLNHGQVVQTGRPPDIIEQYLSDSLGVGVDENTAISDKKVRRGNGKVRFSKVETFNTSGELANEFAQSEDITVRCTCKLNEAVKELAASIALRSGTNREIITTTGKNRIDLTGHREGDTLQFTFTFNKHALQPGIYGWYFWLGDVETDIAFDILDNANAPLVIRHDAHADRRSIGYFNMDYDFEM